MREEDSGPGDPGAALADFRSPTRSGLLAQAGPVFWVVACGAILILGIVLGMGGVIGNFQDREVQRSQKELENTVGLLASQIDSRFGHFESIERSVAADIEQRIKTPEEFKRLLSTEQFHRLLQEKITDPTDFAGVNVFDADGDFINSSERWPVPSLNLSDRKYFKAFKTGSTLDSLLIELVDSRVTPGRTLVMARKVPGPNGELLGLITRSIPPERFEQFFSTVAPAGGTIALLHQDGTLLARFPHAETAIGQSFAGFPLVARDRSAAAYETKRFISPVDGQERFGSARDLDHYPLAILATKTTFAALSNWREETHILMWSAGLAATIICLMLAFIVRYLKAQHRRLDVAVNNMSQGLLLFDNSERLVLCNKRYIDMFNLSPAIIKPGCKLRDVIQHRKDTGSLPGNVEEYCDKLREVSKTGTPSQSVAEMSDGRWMQVANQPLAEGGWVSTIEDVTEQRRSEERMVRLALYDTLTDLPNRAFFLRHLQSELAQCSDDCKLAVLFLDTDEFKAVNDSLGHLVGDELLKSIARKLHGCLGPREFVARLGGDEFAIVASDVGGKEQVLALVERVYGAIRRIHDCAGHRLTIDSSIGIAFAPSDGKTCEEIVQNSDLAMYEAKSAGRRTFRFFEVGMEKKAKERQLLEADLRDAIKSGAIEVYYQPVVDLHRNEIVGCEALARWNHADRGFICPADFIPIAEQSGLIEELGDFVLRKACQEAAANWPVSVKLAVNVSPVQFKSGLFALKVVSALAQSGLSPHRLELEITEAVLIGDDEAALKILHELRAIGVRVALDDFGTGYSSLSYLRRFPFDKVKIDRSFISGLTDKDGSSAIVRAIVAIASEYNMTTTAEGVETEQQRDMLRQLKCDEMQGFLFSPPKPGAQLRESLNGLRERLALSGGTAPEGSISSVDPLPRLWRN
jgi:diguanylate cyclase (GGDEF)-like protein